MTQKWLGVLVVVLVLGLGISAWRSEHTPAMSTAASAIGWERDFETALARASSDRKPVMLDFYTTWCGWCKRLDQTTLADGQVQKALAGVVPLRLDAEREGRELAQRFGVRSFPTIIFLDASGQEIERIPGFVGPDAFLQRLDEVFKKV
jgi:thiol:disulfide interchange protein